MKISPLNIVVELKNWCNHLFLFESADHGYGGHQMILSSGQCMDLLKFAKYELFIHVILKTLLKHIVFGTNGRRLICGKYYYLPNASDAVISAATKDALSSLKNS
uniref:Uncharacterized protein n=1 Tax=Kalanchoe fedtschenkoi TaxID=63787 RepID=A0A7N0TAY5_KALFE